MKQPDPIDVAIAQLHHDQVISGWSREGGRRDLAREITQQINQGLDQLEYTELISLLSKILRHCEEQFPFRGEAHRS